MRLHNTPEETAFRNEVRDFFSTAVPAGTRERVMAGRPLDRAQAVEWQRILNARGWAVPHWAREWGGCGWTPAQHLIFQDEMHAAFAPQSLPFNATMIGPVLIRFGTDRQKQHFLPRAANLDDWWCQGFSEPNSGSDLASLRTRAERDGDVYVVNGQKIWTTYAQHADWMFCLVRTDPAAKKQRGISFLLIDMRSPGIEVRQIRTLDRRHSLNEVFLRDVRVPVENLVGEENRGWDCAKFLLGNERTGIAKVGQSKARLRQIRSLAAGVETPPGFHERLVQAEIDLIALEMMQARGLAEASEALPAMLKVRGSELQQTVLDLFVELAGDEALALGDDADWAQAALRNDFYGLATTIYGGTNEIQKTILSKQLGL